MVRKWFGPGAALAALAATTPAWAQDADELLTKLDANKDGFVSADEVGTERQPLFERLLRRGDKDGDKKLSKDELTAAMKDGERSPPSGDGAEGRRPGREAIEAMFDRQDANSDGKLTKDEVPEERRERFQAMLDRLDTDGDKSLTKEQFVSSVLAMTQREGGRPGRGEGDGPPERRSEGSNEGRPDRPARGPEDGEGPPRPQFGPPAIIRALDTDADGEISADEIKNASASLAKLDKDGDGKLTREELMPGMPGGGRGFGPPPGAGEFARRMKEADANGDGKLSKDEVPERMREGFDRIDTNSDGFLDDAELRQLGERMRPGAGGARRPDGDRPEGDRPRGDGDRPRPEGDGSRSGDRDRPRDAGDRPREGKE
jgi:Ca2+-binding EF-hand superfamily protein